MSSSASNKIVRIGGASAFWGDSACGPIQLAERAEVEYLVFDYLAETTMAILAAARAKDANLGYATDFVQIAMRSILKTVADRRIKVLANAGGINPQACAAALSRLAEELGVRVRVAVVEGDDLNERFSDLPATDLDGIKAVKVPPRTLSANAYLGALPIARALEEGADIVITGRCVDSALTLAPLMVEFGWSATDYDLLAAGSLAGHIIECGCQATGGLHTDWQRVPDWSDIGYPVIECRSDGSFVVTKPPGTGGLIERLAVAEQLLYEIGDPTAYLLPDVICDFSRVSIVQESAERVLVSGARGYAPTNSYKVSATYRDGFRVSGAMIIIGIDADAKARRTGEAILARTRAMFARAGIADYTATLIEVIGAETMYGPHARVRRPREVMVRITVTHDSKQALELFAREIAPSGTSWSPGTTMPPGGRPGASPLIKQFNCLVPKTAVEVRVLIDGRSITLPVPAHADSTGPAPVADMGNAEAGETSNVVTLPLAAIACARSGDKGDRSNIGVIARKPEFLPLILAQLTTQTVSDYFAHLVKGEVRRYLLPGIDACNFVLDEALDGGGPASLRMDPLGKGMAQMLLDFEVRVPVDLASGLA